MSLVRLSDRIIGLSTDTKPNEARGAKLRDGMFFVETDTKKVAVYVSGKWYYTHDQTEVS